MTVEFDRPDNVLDELDDVRLREAVACVRRAELPEEALQSALERAQKLTSVAAAVRRQPTPVKPASRRLAKAVVAVGLLWVVAAFAVSVDRAREEARKNLVANNLRQIGMAFHNYSGDYNEQERYGKSPSVDQLFGMNTDSFYDWSKSINGAIVDNSNSMRVRDVTDGTSSTFAFGEAVGGENWPLVNGVAGKKVIHTADVLLVVKKLAGAEMQMTELVQKHHAEVANFQVSQAQGKQRAAQWIIRVAPDSLDALLKDVSELGIAERRASTGRDVTEEYVDLESQIKNKKQLEQRILELLAKQTGELKDVLAVENELARIRTEIESMEGRKKYLDGVTAMATVSVTVREEQDYVPPEVDSFSNQIGRSWTGSLDLIQGFGKSLVLVAVAAGPWIPIIAALGYIVVRLWRRRRARAGVTG